MDALLYGFAISLSLIFAIGAQNSFVLKQGIRGEHILPVVLVCAFSDMLLFAVGVSGFHLLIQKIPSAYTLALYGGALFLFIYGLLCFKAAFKNEYTLPEATKVSATLSKTLITLIGITWLNPHVYLDTVILVGSISTRFDEKLLFFIGAATASLSFFFALGYGSTLLRPLFSTTRSWRVLDILIGLTMWTIGLSLLLNSSG